MIDLRLSDLSVHELPGVSDGKIGSRTYDDPVKFFGVSGCSVDFYLFLMEVCLLLSSV